MTGDQPRKWASAAQRQTALDFGAQEFVDLENDAHRPGLFDRARRPSVSGVLGYPRLHDTLIQQPAGGPQGKSEDQPHAKQIAPAEGVTPPG